MRKLYNNFKILQIQETIVFAETIRGNTVLCRMKAFDTFAFDTFWTTLFNKDIYIFSLSLYIT